MSRSIFYFHTVFLEIQTMHMHTDVGAFVYLAYVGIGPRCTQHNIPLRSVGQALSLYARGGAIASAQGMT